MRQHYPIPLSRTDHIEEDRKERGTSDMCAKTLVAPDSERNVPVGAASRSSRAERANMQTGAK